MRYEIIDDKGKVINTIMAEVSFVESKYPGKYRAMEEAPAVAQSPIDPVDPLAEIKDKLNRILGDVALLIEQTKK